MIEIEKPKIETVELNEDAKYGKFVIEPLERGYGTTLGNSYVVFFYLHSLVPLLLLSKSMAYYMNFQQLRA